MKRYGTADASTCSPCLFLFLWQQDDFWNRVKIDFGISLESILSCHRSRFSNFMALGYASYEKEPLTEVI